MADDLLTFELGAENDELFIHGDSQGLYRLAKLLERLAAAAEEFPHDHLFTNAWGGSELSSDPQEENHSCLNHVKIYCWPDKRGAAPHRR